MTCSVHHLGYGNSAGKWWLMVVDVGHCCAALHRLETAESISCHKKTINKKELTIGLNNTFYVLFRPWVWYREVVVNGGRCGLSLYCAVST